MNTRNRCCYCDRRRIEAALTKRFKTVRGFSWMCTNKAQCGTTSRYFKPIPLDHHNVHSDQQKNKIMNYTGQKKIPGVIHKIINEIPKHCHFYEIFAGTGAIGQLLPFRKSKHYNDLNKTVLESIGEPSGNTVTKTSVPALNILQQLTTATTDTFIFADPPYLHTVRYSNKLYKFEMSETDHIQLLHALQLLKCNCMIIHPACELYDQALQTWRSVQIKIRYNKKTSIEKLYMNYSVPPALQTYKYIGKDCWQRQGFKRKAQRFLKKGLPLPLPEATYITDML